jgi:hypothetical protein
MRKKTLPGNILVRPYLARSGAYLLRDYLEMSLCERIETNPPLALIEKQWIAFQLLRAIHSLHSRGFSHGDIKPENVLYTSRGFVRLTDHAPFKPKFITRHQPHYFIHFFSYGRGSAFIAPERVVASLTDLPEIDDFAADLFSVGCVLAYLFNGGHSLFDFSTLTRYAAHRCDVDLEGIEPSARGLILGLISLEPKRRVRVFEEMETAFPAWFGAFAHLEVRHKIDRQPIEVVLKRHSRILSLFPEGITEDVIVYETLVGEAIAGARSLGSLLKLIECYREIVLKLPGVEVKIARVMPRLVEVLERGVTVANAHALNALFDVLATIDSLPEQFSQVGSLYLLPRLLRSLDGNENWKYYFTSNIPFVIYNLSRLWPELHERIPHQPLFFLAMMDTRSSDDTRKSGLVSTFLTNGIRVSEMTDSYPIFESLCFIVFQLLNTASNVPLVVDFFSAYVKRLRHSDLRQFLSEFYDSFQKALMSMTRGGEHLQIVFLAFEEMLRANLVYPHQFSFLLQTAITSYSTDDPLLNYAIRAILRRLPLPFRIVASVAVDGRHHSATKRRTPAVGIKRAAFKLVHFATGCTKPRTICAASIKAFDGPVHRLFHMRDESQIVLFHSRRFLSEIRIDAKSADKLQVFQNYEFPQSILSAEKIDEGRLLITHPARLEVRDVTQLGSSGRFLETNVISLSKILNSDTAALVARSVGYWECQIMTIGEWKVISKIDIGERQIIQMDAWPESSLVSIITDDNAFVIYDTRTDLPIAANRVQSHLVVQNLALDRHKCVIRSRRGYEFYDILSEWTPYFRIDRNTDCAMTTRADMILCDQGGTFRCCPERSSWSLFDGSRGRRLNVAGDQLQLPRETEMSLHGHTFTVTAGEAAGKICVTGDQAGYVHLWSPFTTKISVTSV